MRPTVQVRTSNGDEVSRTQHQFDRLDSRKGWTLANQAAPAPNTTTDPEDEDED